MTAAWVKPVDGASTWTPTAPHRELRLTLFGTFVVCLLLSVAFLLLLKTGRAAMCTSHHQQMRYCAGWVEPTSEPQP